MRNGSGLFWRASWGQPRHQGVILSLGLSPLGVVHPPLWEVCPPTPPLNEGKPPPPPTHTREELTRVVLAFPIMAKRLYDMKQHVLQLGAIGTRCDKGGGDFRVAHLCVANTSAQEASLKLNAHACAVLPQWDALLKGVVRNPPNLWAC